MPYGGPPKEDIGPTQGWSGGPPEAPGPRTRTDAGIRPQGGPATPPTQLDADEAQRDAERTAGGGAQREAGGEGDDPG